MALKLAHRSRLIKYVFLLTVLGLTYYFWPVQQIEQLSGSLDSAKKNDYIESILNPEKNEIYDAGSSALKADFNPDKNNLDHSDSMDRKKLNEALHKIKMRPLKNENGEDFEFGDAEPVEKVDILSDTLVKKEFTPVKSISGFLGNLEVDSKSDYYNDLTCSQVSYQPSHDSRKIEYTAPIHLDDDLIEVRRWLLGSNYADIVKLVDPQANDGTFLSDMSHWFKKSGSSIWLPEEQLHMLVSTVMYAPNDRSKPLASFIRLQLFDSNWKEVKGRRIRYTGLSEGEIDAAIREYAKTNQENHLERISLRFPSILNIPFEGKPSKGTLGPEDPRILYKDGEYNSEPVITFNMLTSDNKRNMFAVFPLRAPKGPQLVHSVLKFKNIGNSASTELTSQKNWIPFFDSIKIGDSKSSKGYMYFAYTLDPLVIFKCSLDSGKCNKIQDNIQYSQNVKDGTAYLRGGTSFTPVPRQIIQTLNDGDHKRLQMWVGFPKVLIKKNACGTDVYRPTFSILIREDGVFRLELVTGPIDFGLPTSDECSDVEGQESSVISAHGISFWDIASTGVQESENSVPYFNDYMGIIVGEGNTKIELLVLKNVLNYAMGVYSYGKYMFGNYEVEGQGGVAARTKKVCECALESSLQYGSLIGGMLDDTFKDKTTENW